MDEMQRKIDHYREKSENIEKLQKELDEVFSQRKKKFILLEKFKDL